MTKKKRRIIFLICVAAFLVLVPFFFLYTSGYRLGAGLKLLKTGGLYIGIDQNSAEIFIDGKLKGKTNLLQSNFFLQGLTPRKYSILVAKEGYWPWAKDLLVRPQMVTEAMPLLLPDQAQGKVLTKEDTALFALGGSEYEYAKGLFDKMRNRGGLILPNNSEKTAYRGKQKIYVDELGRVWAEWLDKGSTPPFYFQNDDGSYGDKVLVLNSASQIRGIDFFPGRRDVIIVAIMNGVYALEIDGRGGKAGEIGRIMQPIYTGKTPYFTVSKENSKIYIFDDGKHYIRIDL